MKKLIPAIILVLSGVYPIFAQTKSDREQDGIKGSIQTVRSERMQLVNKDGKWIEIPDSLTISTWIYDAKGRLIEDAEYLADYSPDTKSVSIYDSKGNLIERQSYQHDILVSRIVSTYDESGREVERIESDPKGKTKDRFIDKYDEKGTLTVFSPQLEGPPVKVSTTTYDAKKHPLEETRFRPDGVLEHRTVYTYDGENKTSEIEFYEKEGKQQITKQTYVYDKQGNLIEEATYSNGALETKLTYKFDDKGNRSEVVELRSDGTVRKRIALSYEIDLAGNWTTVTVRPDDKTASTKEDQPYVVHRTFGTATDPSIGLWFAAKDGNLEGIKTLLSQNADVKAKHPDGRDALTIAAGLGYTEAVQLLLSKGADVNAIDNQGWTPLMWASEGGHLDTVNALIAAKANVNAKNNKGGIALMPAALNGNTDVVRTLIAKGADVNTRAQDGSTTLMVVAGVEKPQPEVLKLLLDSGSDVNAKTSDGATALLFAVFGGDRDTIKALIDKSADPNAKMYDGTTPLIIASSKGDVESVKLLLSKKADVNAANKDGKTPLNAAAEEHHQEIIESEPIQVILFPAMRGILFHNDD